MTEYTIKTNEAEAHEITRGERNFIFRADNKYSVGDRITFSVYRDARPVKNPIDGRTFRVTLVSDKFPIEEGYSVIGFEPYRRF